VKGDRAMIIKVCGMREPENIRLVADLGIDWMGFIFYPKSPRYVLKDNFQLSTFNFPLKKVGVFVNESPDQLRAMARLYGLDYLQLHGNESLELCRMLTEEGFHLIKVFSVASEEDLATVGLYEGVADYFLFDTKCKEYGGSGRTFDWSVLEAYKGTTPFLLSGGINPQSVETVSAFNHPQLVGIDLNSGFEVAPAQKDVSALTTFIDKIRKI